MPKNNNLKPVTLPMKLRFGEKPTTVYKNNLESICVKIIDAPSMEQLINYIPYFTEATWAEKPINNMTKEERIEIVNNCIMGKTLPTALETIGITFLIEGISLQEVTHILRHRAGSFSAECSGDKWWTHKNALVPSSIEKSQGEDEIGENGITIGGDNFYERYKTIVKLSKELYCDMIDTKKISIMDARYILPRCLETFYFMRLNLKEAIAFILQRMDTQIQPETDNIIAYQMLLCLSYYYPIILKVVDIDSESKFYSKMARTGKATNLYPPEEQNDTFEWNEKDFIYSNLRSEMNGTNKTEINPNLFSLLRDYYRKIFNKRRSIL